MNRQTFTTLWTLMRRELWENPGIAKWAPVIITALMLFFIIVALIVGARFDAELGFALDAIRAFAEEPLDQRRALVTGALFSSSGLHFQFLILLVLFYLAGSLYEDRKDRSILFWKSLPVSDSMTVASKVATACLLIPLCYLAAAMLTHLAVLLIASGYAVAAGVNPITTFWLPAALPKLWLVLASGLLVQSLWLLPIYAWVMFCSSWAPRVPILIAIAIPLAVALLQHAWSLARVFRMPELNLGLIMLRRFASGLVPMQVGEQFDGAAGTGFQGVRFDEETFTSFSTVLGHLLKPEMWVGVAIAMTLLAGAVWLRRRATDH